MAFLVFLKEGWKEYTYGWVGLGIFLSCGHGEAGVGGTEEGGACRCSQGLALVASNLLLLIC